ncbi:hypothetical protein D3C76_1173920 [compost metagenome]
MSFRSRWKESGPTLLMASSRLSKEDSWSWGNSSSSTRYSLEASSQQRLSAYSGAGRVSRPVRLSSMLSRSGMHLSLLPERRAKRSSCSREKKASGTGSRSRVSAPKPSAPLPPV